MSDFDESGEGFDEWQEETAIRAASTNEIKPSSDRAQLVELVGEGAGRVFTVSDAPLIVGRGADAHVQIAAADASRKHARVWRETPGHFWIEDLDSRNGTRVNGAPIARQMLHYGDKIQISAVCVFVFTHYDDMDEQLLQLQKLDSIGKLAGGIAHDFGSLLQAISANVDYLLQRVQHEKVDDQITEALNETRIAATRGVELTRQLLLVSRREAVVTRPVSLGEMVDDVFRMIQSSLPDNINTKAAVDHDLVIPADSASLHQMLMNLCFNAVDAMPAGGTLKVEGFKIRLGPQSVTREPYVPEGRYLVLRVSDTGVGMNEETRRRAFEPFFTTKDGGQGTGLGLSTVFSVVRNHGGRVGIRSTPGEGTTVEIHLPLKGSRAVPAPTMFERKTRFTTETD